GIETSSARLSERAAQLFKIKLETPRTAIGANTEDALKSGLLYGSIGQIEGIIHRITDELGEKSRIIATGGLAATIAAETEIIDEVDDTLTLFGLRKIYENNWREM
ncbi:type III pantothenate kinase, partial [Candidatus Zixiibacteriota bacterium]